MPAHTPPSARTQAPTPPPAPRPAARPHGGWVATVGVLLAALFYFLLFHRYGFFLQDEGTIAYQALRVARGQIPYADFQTAYTPAGFYLHALVFHVFGTNLVVLRVAASIACAMTTALVYLATARVAPAPWALATAALYVLLEDQESRGFVVHTIAYPARYVSTLWAASLCIALAHARRPRHATAVLLGLLAAAITAFKHTAGIYNAWAAGLCLILVRLGDMPSPTGAAPTPAPDVPAPSAPLARALPFAFLLAMLAGLPMLFGGFRATEPMVAAILCLPLALVALAALGGVWRAIRARARARDSAGLDRIAGELVTFGAAASLPTLLWLAYFAWVAGGGRLIQRLILDGPAVARSYALPFPAPSPLASAALVLAALVGLARAAARRRVLGPWPAAGIVVIVGASFVIGAAAWWIAHVRHLLTPETWLMALDYLGRDIDNLAYFTVPIVAYAYVPRLWRWRGGQGVIDPALVVWIYGLCQILLAYPRLDVAHLYEGFVTTLIAGMVLLARATDFVRNGVPRARHAAAAGLAGALIVVGAVKLAPRIAAQLRWEGRLVLANRTGLAGPRGGLYGTKAEGGFFGTVNRTVAVLEAHVPVGAPLFAYPALAGLNFLAERDNPTGLDYFHRGFGEGADEVAVLGALVAQDVDVVVLLDDVAFDPPEHQHFPMLKAHLARQFRPEAMIATFRVLARLPSTAPGAEQLFPTGIVNGDFATGTLAGFRAEHDGGTRIDLVPRAISPVPARPAAGPASTADADAAAETTRAVRLFSAGNGADAAVAILTSLPFIPGGPDLALEAAPESPGVDLDILFLDPAADTLAPAAAHVQGRALERLSSVAGAGNPPFIPLRLPFPGGPDRPVKVQFRPRAPAPHQSVAVALADIRSDTRRIAPDADGDSVPDSVDNCAARPNRAQTNSDGDAFGDACDDCPFLQNNTQADRDGDGTGDRCASDLDGDGFPDADDVALLVPSPDGAIDPRADLDGDGRVGLVDTALFAGAVRVGIDGDRFRDFTESFVDHSVNGGIGIRLRPGWVFSSVPGTDLIRFPGRYALMVRSGPPGDPGSEGVFTSRPFVPDAPWLRVLSLSESPHVRATVRVLRPRRDPTTPVSADILLERPLANDRPATGPMAEFEEQWLDLRPWFNADDPRRGTPIQLQFRQHTLQPGAGYFTLIGEIRGANR